MIDKNETIVKKWKQILSLTKKDRLFSERKKHTCQRIKKTATPIAWTPVTEANELHKNNFHLNVLEKKLKCFFHQPYDSAI